MIKTNESRQKLYIPARIKVQTEPIKGYSSNSLKRALISGGTATLVCILLGMLIGDVSYGVLIWFFSVGICVVVFRENELNMNIIDYIIVFAKFQREQQQFEYTHKDETIIKVK